MAIKNAVTVKNRPNLWSTRTVTTNLESMNSLTKKQAKPSWTVRESQRSDVWSWMWIWIGSSAIPIANAKQKATIALVQFILRCSCSCSTTNPGSCSSSSSTSLSVVDVGNRGSNFDKTGTIYVINILKNSFAFEFKFMFWLNTHFNLFQLCYSREHTKCIK